MSIVKINVRTPARATKKKISIYKNNSFTLTLPLNMHRDVLCEQIKERFLHEMSLSYVDRISASLQITVHNNGEKVFFLLIDEFNDNDDSYSTDNTYLELTPQQENFYFCKAIEQLGEDLKALAELEGMEE